MILRKKVNLRPLFFAQTSTLDPPFSAPSTLESASPREPTYHLHWRSAPPPPPGLWTVHDISHHIKCNYKRGWCSGLVRNCFFSCDQAAIWLVQSVRLSVRPSVCLSVRPSVCLSHLFHHVPIIVSSWNFQELLPWSKVMSMQKVKVRGQRSRSQRSTPNLAVSGLLLQFEFTYGSEIMHTAGSSIEEVPYCFSRSSVKFQGHTALKIVEFDPDWSFPDCNSSLNKQMARKWCTKLEVALKRCPIVFQGHPSNFKVTRL